MLRVMFLLRRVSPAVLAVLLAVLPATASAQSVVRFDTVEGAFDVELFDDAMPRTVANFLFYVMEGRYDGSVVHRNSDTADPILRDFVIQGGGFFLSDPAPGETVITFGRVTPETPILDEPGGGVAGPSNVRGTLAMAKAGPGPGGALLASASLTTLRLIRRARRPGLSRRAAPRGSRLSPLTQEGPALLRHAGSQPSHFCHSRRSSDRRCPRGTLWRSLELRSKI
jgi:cyclophilin family peptidyl-prolyl cis-trans isomerase